MSSTKYINRRGEPTLLPPEVTAFGEARVANQTPEAQVIFAYNNNPRLVDTTVTGSGTVTNVNSMASANTTAATSSSAMVATHTVLTYRAGRGGLWRGTGVFTTPKAGSRQYVGCGVPGENGFFFGYKDTEFGISHWNAGTETWIPQANWNLRRMDGSGEQQTLDPTKGNVFEVSFQYLGFGACYFSVEDRNTGHFLQVHRLAYANSNTTPSLGIPHLPACIKAENTTNDTAISVKAGSMYLAVEGPDSDDLNPVHSQSRDAFAYTTAGQKAVFTIRNLATYVGQTNYISMLVEQVSVAVDGTKNALVRLVLNATLGGTPAFADHETDVSVAEVDTAGTTVTGGEVMAAFTLDKTGSEWRDFTRPILLRPGDSLTLSVESANATTVAGTLNWSERH